MRLEYILEWHAASAIGYAKMQNHEQALDRLKRILLSKNLTDVQRAEFEKAKAEIECRNFDAAQESIFTATTLN